MIQSPESNRLKALLPSLQMAFAQQLGAALPAIIEKLDTELFNLSLSSKEAELQSLFQNIRSTIQSNQPQIMSGFHATLAGCMQRRNLLADSPAARPQQEEGLGLSLVEFDEMEITLGVNNLAQQLTELSSKELNELSARIQKALRRNEPDNETNPFGPAMVAAAMRKTFAAVEGVRPQLILLKSLAQPLAETLNTLYHALNTALQQNGFEPAIAASSRAEARPTPMRPAGTADTPTTTAATSHTTVSSGAGDFTQTIQQLLHAPAVGGGSGGSGGQGPVLSTQEVLNALSQFSASLPQLLQNNAAAQQNAGEGAAISAALTNVLHQIRTTPAYNNASQVDAITIDVVAMMFDFIFEDEDIPDAIKALLARLQLPILKAAMQDKQFFSKRDNPARHLLDSFARAAVGWDEKQGEADPLFCKIEELVLRVVDQFEQDHDIFLKAADELDAFLQAEQQKAEARSRAAAEEIYKRELQELAQESAQIQIKSWCKDGRCEGIIAEFLQQYWLMPLTRAHGKDGKNTDAWRQSYHTIEDLLWSLTPKNTAEERQRLLKLIPQLRQTLESTLQAQQAPEAFSHQLFAYLVEKHTQALKGSKTVRDAVKSADAPVSTPDNTKSSSVDTAEMQHAAVTAFTSAAETPAADEFDQIAHHIQKGTWVEFKIEGGTRTIRCRLLWTSPVRGAMLFASRDGGNAIKISPSSLASRLRSGRALLLDGEPLVDRAVGNVLNRMQQEGRPAAA